MTVTAIEVASASVLERVILQHRVEQFYYDEAALLDRHAYTEWVQLFTDDTHYFMPVRRTVLRRDLALEFTSPGETAFFDDSKPMLQARAEKFLTGKAWAEDPPSRTRHIITNVRITENSDTELRVESNFLLYRTRLKSEEDQWIGSRKDVLRPAGDSFQIAGRTILLEQTVLLSRNLSNLF